VHDKKDNTCLLTDTAIPDDSNVSTKETEKLSKYEGLEIEVRSHSSHNALSSD